MLDSSNDNNNLGEIARNNVREDNHTATPGGGECGVHPNELAAPASQSTLLKAAPALKGVFIKTYGCQMNVYDSEKIVNLLSANYRIVETPEEADVIYINTCSVRDKAEHKLYSILGALSLLKKERLTRVRQDVILGVGGCVAQQEGWEIIKRFPAVNFVVGTHNISLVPGLISAVQTTGLPQVAVDYREEWEDLPDGAADGFSLISLGTGDVNNEARAAIAIQRGCNKNCAFCVVPTTRGKEVSRSPREVEREVRYKVSQGAVEVLLLGQTVNSYGRDLNPRVSFSDLVKRVASIDGVKRIRFTSPHPADVKDDFIALYDQVPQLCPYIHLPLQSGSDRILKLMNRNYRIGRYLEIVDKLKSARNDIAISTDIIVGFPTESDEDFKLSLDVLTQVNYSQVYAFKYSRRPNTKAFEMFVNGDEVIEKTKKQRLEILQLAQEQIVTKFNRGYLGTQQEVLVDGISRHLSSGIRGRNAHNVIVEINAGCTGDRRDYVGKIVNISITSASAYGMTGMLV